jgi:hypothetical protein
MLLKTILSALVPRMLPQTDSAFEALVARVCAAAGAPVNDSFINAIGSQVMRLGPQTAFMVDLYFILTIKRAVASQAAYSAIEAVRARAKEATPDETPV